MTKPGQYVRKAVGWFVYLFLVAGFHGMIAGSLRAQSVSFVAPNSFSVGADPLSIGVGDFNRDGNRDLAVANNGSSNVSVLLGNGDGTFQPAVNFPVGGSPNSLVVSYFNGDSIQDLAVSSSSGLSGNVSVLLGKGDGTFQPAMSFPATAFSGMDYGDFNNDGFGDVVVPGALLLGNGDGTFRPPLNAPVGLGPSGIVAGYFNDDGILDIAAIEFPGPPDYRLRVHLGNGDGTFQSPIFIMILHAFGGSLAVGYFNRDAIADLVVSDVEFTSVSVLLGNGDGTFRFGDGFIGGGSFAIEDFDGDTIADLVYGSGLVARGRGDGTFHQPWIAVASHGYSFVVSDFNGDGRKDLAGTSGPGFSGLGDPTGKVSILLGWGTGTFQGSWIYSLERGSARDPLATVAVGEFNRDGIQDLAVTNAGKISILLGSGDGQFGWLYDFDVGGATSLAVGEFNRDGIQDLVTAFDGGVAVYIGNGNGFFQPPLNFPSVVNPSSIVVDYFNSDGFLDLAVLSRSDRNISVLLGNGDGTFRAPQFFDTGTPVSDPNLPYRRLAAGDFNGDGNQDLVTTATSAVFLGSVSVLLGNGDGTFRTPLISAVAGTPVSVAVGDFNSDHIQDLAVGYPFARNVSVLLGNGSGTFGTPLNVDGHGGEALAIGDFNSDGIQDLAVGHESGSVSVLPGIGNGTFQPAVDFRTSAANSLAVGDFSGDGRPDIAAAGSRVGINASLSNALTVLINNTR